MKLKTSILGQKPKENQPDKDKSILYYELTGEKLTLITKNVPKDIHEKMIKALEPLLHRFEEQENN